mgnify:CR=1 FL=1|tara:strand:+ start:50 stop:433 length:384 start_codon:yes stop_codon:yes gene_type:complete
MPFTLTITEDDSEDEYEIHNDMQLGSLLSDMFRGGYRGNSITASFDRLGDLLEDYKQENAKLRVSLENKTRLHKVVSEKLKEVKEENDKLKEENAKLKERVIDLEEADEQLEGYIEEWEKLGKSRIY